MELKFTKCHGSGNDFLILDEYTAPLSMTDEERASLTIKVCNRETGLGADGVLFFQKSEVADGKMRVFNSDGSEASMCGNGLRCIARYGCELLGKKQLRIETMKAVLLVEETESIHESIPTYKVEISPVSFQVSDLPMNIDTSTFINQKIEDLASELTFTAVAVPNPHFITLVDTETLQSDLQEKMSSYLNRENPYFPDGVNVSFIKILEKENIYVRTYERGVGFTNACGTAMSASTLVTCLLNENVVGEEVTVYNPGGKVKCVVHDKEGIYSIDLIGNATYEYEVTISYVGDEVKTISKTDFINEVQAYSEMQVAVKDYLKSKI